MFMNITVWEHGTFDSQFSGCGEVYHYQFRVNSHCKLLV
jgi:hypothetical protein